MTINKILDQYKSEYPFFAKLKLSKTGNNEKNLTETLPPFLQFTTYLIEKFISEGKRRIGIVLPGEEIPLLPLFVSSCLKDATSLETESNNSVNILSSCEKGQHLRIGKAVVEFVNIDGDKVKFKLGRSEKDSLESSYIIGSWTAMLEKTQGALSKTDTALLELRNLQNYAKTAVYQQNQSIPMSLT